MKKLSKITICLFMMLSFLFVGNVRAEDGDSDIKAIENLVTKAGGKEECPPNSYVCLMGLSAVRITYYVDGEAKNGYNVFDTNQMTSKKWSNWLDDLTQKKITRYGTSVSKRKYVNIVNVDWRLDTKTKQNKFYKAVRKSIQNLDSWVVEIINEQTGQSFTSSTDKKLRKYVEDHKAYFVIEPLYFFKIQDLKTADDVGFGNIKTPNFSKFLYTANQIGQELVDQTKRCEGQNYGTWKCKQIYSDRSNSPHTKKIATNMRLKKNQIKLLKGADQKKYRMDDLVKDETQTGLGVGVIRLKYRGGGTVSTPLKYVCYAKNEGCEINTYSITSDVSDDETYDDDGSTCTNGSYSQSEYGVVTALKDNKFCHVYCTKNIEFNVPKSFTGAFKTPWATANSDDNFTITKTGSYDCKIDFEYYYGENTLVDNPPSKVGGGWKKDTIVKTYGTNNRITLAQALLAQALENVQAARDDLCPGEDLEPCAQKAIVKSCPGLCNGADCDFAKFTECATGTLKADPTKLLQNPDVSTPENRMTYHYWGWLNAWKIIKESYAQCANYAPNPSDFFSKNNIVVKDTDGNTKTLEPKGTVECTGACKGEYVVDYSDNGKATYVVQPLPGSYALTQNCTTNSNGNQICFNTTLQKALAASATNGLCKYWVGSSDGIEKGQGYNSICLLKRFYEFKIESRGNFSIDVDYTYEPTKYYKADFNKSFDLNDSEKPGGYNSFSNEKTTTLAEGTSNICKWNSNKFNKVFGSNSGDISNPSNTGNTSTNKITYDLSNDKDATTCNFSNSTIEMKKTLSNETCACPASTVHAGTNAYYWINNDLLTNAGVIEKFKEGATCAEAISMVCRDDSLSSDPDGYEEPTDLDGEPITDCLISGIQYQKCVESGAKTYACNIKTSFGDTVDTYIDKEVYEEAKKQSIDIGNDTDMGNLASKVCSDKNKYCDTPPNEIIPDFIYRTVQLNNGSDIPDNNRKISFPGKKGEGRTPGSNWSDNDIKTVLKTENANYNGTPMYTIKLNSKTIKEIRNYNDKHPYDYIGNLECSNADGTISACVSRFVHDEKYGIQKNESKCGDVTSDPKSFYSTGCVNYYGRS